MEPTVCLPGGTVRRPRHPLPVGNLTEVFARSKGMPQWNQRLGGTRIPFQVQEKPSFLQTNEAFLKQNIYLSSLHHEEHKNNVFGWIWSMWVVKMPTCIKLPFFAVFCRFLPFFALHFLTCPVAFPPLLISGFIFPPKMHFVWNR